MKKRSATRNAKMKPDGKQFLVDRPGRYCIRVQGWLSASWSSRLSDMVITVKQPASQPALTTLTGEVTDQAALLGVLNTLFDLGYPLLKVERLDPLTEGKDSSRQSEGI